MNIYTSYYANAKKLDIRQFAFVRVSTSVPKWWNQPTFSLPKLYPGWDLVDPIKSGNISWEEYTKEYNRKLSKLNKTEILKKMTMFSSLTGIQKDIVLLCYEKPEENCHRHLIADWLGNVKEYGYELDKNPNQEDCILEDRIQ